MKMDSLDKLFEESLADLYSAEKQLTDALPKAAKAAKSADLRAAFESHLKETEGHVERLEKVFKEIGGKPEAKTCMAMQGLVKEAAEAIKIEPAGAIRDAGLIGAAQRIEHYEMAAYGTARAFAETLGQSKARDLLQATLDEESKANEKLTQIAESTVNREAASV